MFRLFKLIVFILISYKLVQLFLTQFFPKEEIDESVPKQKINLNNQGPNMAPKQPERFNDAEVIEYEEVK